MVADYKPGATVLLKRNPNYWKTDAQGRKLPYLDSIRLDIQPNRDVEMLRFKRSELESWLPLGCPRDVSDVLNRRPSTGSGVNVYASLSTDEHVAKASLIAPDSPCKRDEHAVQIFVSECW